MLISLQDRAGKRNATDKLPIGYFYHDKQASPPHPDAVPGELKPKYRKTTEGGIIKRDCPSDESDGNSDSHSARREHVYGDESDEDTLVKDLSKPALKPDSIPDTDDVEILLDYFERKNAVCARPNAASISCALTTVPHSLLAGTHLSIWSKAGAV